MTALVTERPRTPALRMLLEAAVIVVFLLLIWNNYTLRRQQPAGAQGASPARGFIPKDLLETIPTVALDGKPGTLDLRQSRSVVAIVDPRCESCKELIATLRPQPGLHVLSVAPLAETRTMAAQSNLTAVTRILGEPLPDRIGAQFHVYPQVFVVDRGKVVRTCATVGECR
ncbi:MAG TPA: hypothetical protein VFV49_15000 [Thermoanaerobaculia bacterium]|nr:hypothetical protein [Thermoanaerobaculia bacterium]